MLTEFLDTVIARLQANDRLNGIDILSEEDRTISTRIKQAMGSGLGSVIVVKFGPASTLSSDAPGPHLDNLTLETVCYETPQTNRANNRLTALQMAEINAAWLHWPNHPNEPLMEQIATTFSNFTTGEKGIVLYWTAIFRTSLTLTHPQ